LILAAAIVLAGCGNSGDANNGGEANNGAAAGNVENAANTGAVNAAAENAAANTDQDAGAPAGDSGGETAAADSAALIASVKELVDGLKKSAESGTVDWAAVEKSYNENIAALVQARDAETENQVHEQLTAALAGGKEGTLAAGVVAQLYDKLLQKVAFLQMRHEFKEANEAFTDKAKVKAELQEARAYYEGILKGMVEKRDNAYETQLIAAIDGGFGEMEQAADKGDNLAYNLGKQVVDKTLMKAFYLASGAEKGYGYKVEKAAKEGKTDDAKIGQAEGWAFFQSVKAYVERYDADAAKLIEGQFDLSNDVKNVKGDEINKAYIRGFAAVAKGEYEESFENWGKDKAVITALEGALFIDVIKTDLAKALGGEDKAAALADNAQQLLDKVKAGDKAAAEELYKKVEADLNTLTAYGKAG